MARDRNAWKVKDKGGQMVIRGITGLVVRRTATLWSQKEGDGERDRKEDEQGPR